MPWLRTKGAARYLALNPDTLREKAQKGIIDGGRTDGGEWRFHTDDLDRYLRQNAEPDEDEEESDVRDS